MALDFKTSDATDVEREHIFSIDGEKYYVDKKPRAALSLKYLHVMATQGEDAATDFMLSNMLGEEAYEALMNYDELTIEQLEAVFEALQKIMLGETEKNLPKKPSKAK